MIKLYTWNLAKTVIIGLVCILTFKSVLLRRLQCFSGVFSSWILTVPRKYRMTKTLRMLDM